MIDAPKTTLLNNIDDLDLLFIEGENELAFEIDDYSFTVTYSLEEDDFFSRYQIINLSADGVGAGTKALEYLNEQMNAGENTGKLGSIAITVNKLTIGVTVKKWSSVFVLKDLASPESYFQAIFRIQTPYTRGDEILKKDGFVFDFNIDRAASLLLKYADESSKEFGYTKMQVAKLIVNSFSYYSNKQELGTFYSNLYLF